MSGCHHVELLHRSGFVRKISKVIANEEEEQYLCVQEIAWGNKVSSASEKICAILKEETLCEQKWASNPSSTRCICSCFPKLLWHNASFNTCAIFSLAAAPRIRDDILPALSKWNGDLWNGDILESETCCAH
mmetsp:Transcript_11749/g.24752  ORF Transcript_11749/g.24752 Transcript_11749/m.24752 type:complete len:132 (+) Transcript_11749:96-491(+)